MTPQEQARAAAVTRRIASAVGCRLLRDERGQLLWECDDQKKVVKLLRLLADRDAKHPQVRRFASRLLEASGGDAAAFSRGVHRMFLQNIEWRREDPETFQHTLFTLQKRYGDCDDHGRAIVALHKAVNIPARLVVFNNQEGQAAHAVAQAAPDGERWRWVETSVAARYGEHPMKAAARLGLRSRLNFAAPKLNGVQRCTCESQGMGVVITPDKSDSTATVALVSIALDAGLFGVLGGGLGAMAATVWPGVKVEEGFIKGSAYGAALGGLSGLVRVLGSKVAR